jgi:hypothetical protein
MYDRKPIGVELWKEIFKAMKKLFSRAFRGK